MRGHYYSDLDRAILAGLSDVHGGPKRIGRSSIVPVEPVDVEPVKVESEEDRNSRENSAKQLAGEGPQVIAGPDTPASGADIVAIVRAVAMAILQSELDYHGIEELRDYYPQLAGIEEDQIRRVYTEDLE